MPVDDTFVSNWQTQAVLDNVSPSALTILSSVATSTETADKFPPDIVTVVGAPLLQASFLQPVQPAIATASVVTNVAFSSGFGNL